jgi:hypothetical protein
MAKTTVFLVWPAVLACAREIPSVMLEMLEQTGEGESTYQQHKVQSRYKGDTAPPSVHRDLCVEGHTQLQLR